MPQFQLAGITQEFNKLDQFTQGYIEALFFADLPEGQSQGFSDLTKQSLETIIEDCKSFQAKAFAACPELGPEGDNAWEAGKAGRDFWYTRQGHGCGFWDGDWDEPHATILTDLSKTFGELSVSGEENGRLYVE